MKRLLGIDYGKKRVGVAVSDPLKIFASPLDPVPTANIVNYLKNYTSENEVEMFVVGYPVNMDNKPSERNAGHEIAIYPAGAFCGRVSFAIQQGWIRSFDHPIQSG